ncbi:3-deoxy-7-phosphoheptulonate synthase [Embleya sp. NPDC008237]|uniref:3-deoxy-7-phosphoheptulonate synthase n=1 Tax=Embleya sp. NPDC008237 TaxID=3363978 RepID=UPI0036E442A5
MIVVLEQEIDAVRAAGISAELASAGVATTPGTDGGGRAVLVSERGVSAGESTWIRGLPGVAEVTVTPGKYRLTSRVFRPTTTTVDIGAGVVIGGPGFVVAAGPCAVENAGQLDSVARAVAAGGAAVLRGGAFKPRSSPYSFQGLEESGLRLLEEQRARTGLPVVTEVLEPAWIERVAKSADILQIGARNMQNYPLLREAGRSGLPVLLKRGLSATVEEWLLAAEYVLLEGNPNVILCERGIRSYEPSTRFTLDLSAIPVVKRVSHLPVIVDPSHASGRADLVRPMALAAAAAGADGLLVDVHTDAASAQCDADQALTGPEFAELVEALERVLDAVDRPLTRPVWASAAEAV